MQIVLLSGGSGKRLWPLSNAIRSKQFLQLLPSTDGSLESMVQRVVRQIKDSSLADSVTVATASVQADILLKQLGSDVDVVAEPSRRDTFPAIALASMYLRSRKKCSRDEIVVVMPCDPFTERGYFEAIAKMVITVEATGIDLALMGIRPSYPSTKFGYIVPTTERVGTGFKVARFTEKPSEDKAIELLAQNALWNGGVFAFRLGYLEDIVDKYLPKATYKDVYSHYDELPKISFDYEVVEKAEKIAVVPFDGLWEDLGTWNTLTTRMPSDTIGKVLKGDACENTHVVNYLDIPVFCNGVKDLVVVACQEGILVCSKDKCETLKESVEKIEEI